MMKATGLAPFPSLRHGFFTRSGGHSKGLYESLNCGLGSKDDTEAVTKNRDFCAAGLGVTPDKLVTVHQEHTADVVVVSAPWSADNAPVADGLVTNIPGLALAILTADCTPVLLADPESGVIGAAHAGWKGALTGIVGHVVDAMVKLGAERARIIAAIGPCISGESYEVGPEFYDRFHANNPAYSIYFKPSDKDGHWYFDIGVFVLDRAKAAGIKSAERIAADTYTDEELFFSYRRSCHNREHDYGRQLSGISWVP
jgi:polyphenol oxidase